MSPPFFFLLHLKHPNIPKEQEHNSNKGEPDPPADTRAAGHAQHPVHRRSQADARAFERVVHLLGQGGRVADLVSYGDGYLGDGWLVCWVKDKWLGVKYKWKVEGEKMEEMQLLTSLSILTLALIPSI